MNESMDDRTAHDRLGGEMILAVDLAWEPVAVWLHADDRECADAAVLKSHRYCQAIMKARKGEPVILYGDEIACPAAASAFGFRPLPDALGSGKGLVGFGIVSDPAVGQRMFEGMSRLEPGSVQRLLLSPLRQAQRTPDVVVVEDEVEKLMWIALSYLHATGGQRLQGSTAVLQATCVDSTILPFLEQRLNFGYGCYGCREATDLGRNEAVLGFPGHMLPAVVEHVKFLKEKAIPNARSRRVLHTLQQRETGETR